MKWFLAVLLTVCVAVVVAFYNIPASAVGVLLTELESRRLLPADAPKLALADFDGTLWDGRARRSTLLVDGVRVDLGQLHWMLDKASLLRGAPRLVLDTHSDELQLRGAVALDSTGRIALSNVEGHAPVSLLEPWIPMLVTGDIGFFFDEAIFTATRPEALNGMVNLEYVDWVGADYNMPLGSYMAEVSLLDHNQVSIVINDLEARLGCTGTFTVDLQGNYRLDAILQPRPELAPEVVRSIRWLGRDDGQGNVLIDQRGRFH